MAYVKHTWQNGELITAEKLYNMECGIDCLANCSCIWENDNPEASFEAQSISLDISRFNKLEFYLIIEDEDAFQTVFVVLNKNRAYQKNGAWNLAVKYGNYTRYITITDSTVSFSNCKYGISYNNKLIPISIHAFE